MRKLLLTSLSRTLATTSTILNGNDPEFGSDCCSAHKVASTSLWTY